MSKYLIKYSVVVDGQGTTFGRPEDHEREVEATLATLMATTTGRAVFRKIVAHGVVLIRPYLASSAAKYTKCNALAFGNQHRQKVASGLTRPAVEVQFSTGTWTPANGCLTGPGAQGDEILLHELIHAMRNLGGDARHVPLNGKLGGYHNEEEYFAVLVSNIYISEMGRQPNFWAAGPGKSGLRADHSGFSHLPDEQALVVDFLSDADNYRLVKKFCQQHPKIAPLIGEATARFNPIKVFYRWQKLGIQPSGGAFVRSR